MTQAPIEPQHKNMVAKAAGYDSWRHASVVGIHTTLNSILAHAQTLANDEAKGKALAEIAGPVLAALDYADGMICRHDETYRGGVLWEICGQCGMKWVDDRGGFKPSLWPDLFDKAKAALTVAAPYRASDPVAEAAREAIGAIWQHGTPSRDAVIAAVIKLARTIERDPGA